VSTRLTVLCLVVFALAGTVSAQEVDGVQLFPIVARTTGVGTSQWVTDLTVHNLMDQSITLGLQFFPADQANTFDPTFPDRMEIGPRETVLIEDVLSEFFGHESDIKGVLLVSADDDMISGNPDDVDILAVTRTYNKADPDGTYGQTVPSLELVTVNSTPLVVTGARNDAAYRSNLGLIHRSLESITVHYRVLDGDGGVVAGGSRNLPEVSVKQFSFQQLGVGSTDGPLTVELRIDPDDISPDPCADFANAILGYVSKVDNGTGDGEFLYAAPIHDVPCDW
jgi:hypothetical protein